MLAAGCRANCRLSHWLCAVTLATGCGARWHPSRWLPAVSLAATLAEILDVIVGAQLIIAQTLKENQIATRLQQLSNVSDHGIQLAASPPGLAADSRWKFNCAGMRPTFAWHSWLQEQRPTG